MADSNSEKATDLLYWCYQNLPGERISFHDVARIVYGIKRVRPNNIRGVKSMISHIHKRVWETYSLGFSSNDVGMKITANVHEYMQTDYRRRLDKFAAGKRSLDFGQRVVDSKQDEFEDNQEGRNLKKLAGQVRKVCATAVLPARDEVRALLGATSDDS